MITLEQNKTSVLQYLTAGKNSKEPIPPTQNH